MKNILLALFDLKPYVTIFAMVVTFVLFGSETFAQTNESIDNKKSLTTAKELSAKEKDAKQYALDNKTMAFVIQCAPSQIDYVKNFARNTLTYMKNNGVVAPKAHIEASKSREGQEPTITMFFFGNKGDLKFGVNQIDDASFEAVNQYISNVVDLYSKSLDMYKRMQEDNIEPQIIVN